MTKKGDAKDLECLKEFFIFMVERRRKKGKLHKFFYPNCEVCKKEDEIYDKLK